ncbi:MAG: P-II family nitrogen regulator [Gemmatimonadales bacterium]
MAEELWMVMAVIQPFKLDSVTRALENVVGFAGMTVSDCRGFGREKLDSTGEREDEAQRYQSDAGLIDFTSKVRLDIAVAGQENADAVAEALLQSAHTGRRGDGKIFLWPLTRVVRVRTAEQNAEAL